MDGGTLPVHLMRPRTPRFALFTRVRGRVFRELRLDGVLGRLHRASGGVTLVVLERVREPALASLRRL